MNRSTALRCFGTDRQWAPFFLPISFPSTPAEEQTWMNADLFPDSSCAQRGGRIADHMATADVARDLDVLTVHGWGHASLFLSQCADALQTRYLVDLALPAVGTVCA